MYKAFVKPLLFRQSPDDIHESTVRVMSEASESATALKLAQWVYNYQAPELRQEILGLTFRNPVGLAAGFDKNGKLGPVIEAAGFGFLEVGSITAVASAGNPKPRTFRLEQDRSLINRMGLNNDGAATIIKRLKKMSLSIPLGINIAKTHDPAISGEAALDDYFLSFEAARDVADYITLNISCPNTAEGKTFEDPEAFCRLLEKLQIDRNLSLPPVFVKFFVDLERPMLEELIAVARSHSISGYVAVNTSSGRDGLSVPASRLEEIGRGGLSGMAIRDRSTEFIRTLHDLNRDEKPIIGVGGIFSAEDAIEKIKAGADLLQVYTGLIYEGPGLVKRINKGIHRYMKKNDLEYLYQIRGKARRTESIRKARSEPVHQH